MKARRVIALQLTLQLGRTMSVPSSGSALLVSAAGEAPELMQGPLVPFKMQRLPLSRTTYPVAAIAKETNRPY